MYVIAAAAPTAPNVLRWSCLSSTLETPAAPRGSCSRFASQMNYDYILSRNVPLIERCRLTITENKCHYSPVQPPSGGFDELLRVRTSHAVEQQCLPVCLLGLFIHFCIIKSTAVFSFSYLSPIVTNVFPPCRKCWLRYVLWMHWPQLCASWHLLWDIYRSSPQELPAWYDHTQLGVKHTVQDEILYATAPALQVEGLKDFSVRWKQR